MYISDEVIKEIRKSADIKKIVAKKTKLKDSGNILTGACPFCKEELFTVDVQKQTYTCFGCRRGGDVIQFLMESEHKSFPEVVLSLGKEAGIKVPFYMESDEFTNRKNTILGMNRLAVKHFERELKGSEEAKKYFSTRGLTEDTIEKFKLGYDNPKDPVFQKLLTAGYVEDILLHGGLASKTDDEVYDRFYHRVMFPILNERNLIIGFGGRVLDDKKPKYLNSPETLVFDKSDNLYALNFAKDSEYDYFLLCEGYMDVISLHQAGFSNAVASLGTALTLRQAKKLKTYKNKVMLTYDSDGPGMKAVERAIPILRSLGMDVAVVNMNPYKDPDEFIKALGASAYLERIEKALPAEDWLIQGLASQDSADVAKIAALLEDKRKINTEKEKI